MSVQKVRIWVFLRMLEAHTKERRRARKSFFE